MLNKTSAQLGVNLARIFAAQSKNLTPVKGSLMDELANASFVPAMLDYDEADDSTIANAITSCSTGPYSETSSGTKTYTACAHDALMDNYIVTLSNLVSQQVAFSRSTVYPKVQSLSEQVTQTLATCSIKNPEDLFDVRMYTLPQALTHDLIDSEVLSYTPSSASNTYINFKEDIYRDFDLLSYIKTDTSEFDAAVSAWYSSSDKDKLFGYVFSKTMSVEAAMSVNDFIDYSLINFLFYRRLALSKDIQTGLSAVELTVRANNNRDYYARALKAGIESYTQVIRKGVILSSDSVATFSYIGEKTCPITIYEESFAQAAAHGATIEQVFGFIAQFSSQSITVDMIKAEGHNYLRSWERVRGLYLAYINGQRDTLFKMALRRNFSSMLTDNLSEEDAAFFSANTTYVTQTLELANAYIDKITVEEMNDSQKVYVDLVARIAYRDSAASIIIPEMVRLLNKDHDIEPQQAALISTVKYVTNYLLDQVTVTN